MMDMDSPTTFPPDYPPCALYGNGTHQLGHYVPTGAERTYCQADNEPWASSARFGLYTTYFLVATTFLFIVARVVKFDRGLRSLCAKPLAVARLLTYPVFSTLLPSLGNSLLILAFAIFSIGFTFGNRVYTRPPNFGSWPVALRAEFIATAMLPWIYQLPAKRNLLSCLTAISHEKMQNVHQYGGWILLALSFVHTIALQIRAMRQAPWSYTWSTNTAYTTGYAALAPLAILCLFSLSPLRRKWYEAFYIVHFLAAVFFLWLITNHAMRELGSQYYCYAAMALWSAALIWRHGTVLLGLARHLARGRGLPRAQFELLPGGLIRMTLRTQMSWKVGQHIFLRVLECRPAETHPFTIASLPGRAVSGPQDTESGVPADDGLNELVLIIRPVDGFTGRLAKIVESRAEGGKTVAFPVLVDGPYGEAVSFGSFDSVVLVAGGSGISFALPILHDILSTTQKSGSCSRINLIWAARDSVIFEQFRPELDAILATAPKWTKVEIATFATHGSCTAAGDSDAEMSVDESSIDEKHMIASAKPGFLSCGRPEVGQYISEATTAVGSGRLAVGVCGPDSLLNGVRNAVAQCQKDILLGRIAAEEVALESAVFGW